MSEGSEAEPKPGRDKSPPGQGTFFSKRTSWETTESEWARLLRERRENNLPIFDLTASNPTECGFNYDLAEILCPLADPEGLKYAPDPHGMLSAREAVCQYYQDHGANVTPRQIFLTTSTSEGYSFLFRLLCDPGDEVLIAQPSYPLFDFIAALDDVSLVTYPLFYDYGWHIDIEILRQRITPRSRAVVVIHPNNPTGHFTAASERDQIEALCLEHGLALIVDEVFLDYPLGETQAVPGRGRTFASTYNPVLPYQPASNHGSETPRCSTFILSGLSKICGLPQMKASWVVCLGPEVQQAEAIQRLEVIADTFLSMNAPVQHALAAWLAGRETIQVQIRCRTVQNLDRLDRALLDHPSVTRLKVEGGWSAILRIPAVRPDEETALALLRSEGVAVHAGSLYGFQSAGWLVISLLTPDSPFSAGLTRMLNYISELR